MPSTQLKKAATAPETDEVLLTLLTIYVDDKPVLYLCDNTESIESHGHEFIPWSFKVVLPDQTTEGSKTCKLQIDNTTLETYKVIKSAINKKITVDVAIILASTPDVYEEGPYNFILRNVKANVSAITGELYDFYIHDRKFTGLKYTPEDFPGLFF